LCKKIVWQFYAYAFLDRPNVAVTNASSTADKAASKCTIRWRKSTLMHCRWLVHDFAFSSSEVLKLFQSLPFGGSHWYSRLT